MTNYKKKRILIHTHRTALLGGGVQKVLKNLVSNLNDNLYDITILAYTDSGKCDSEVYGKRIKYYNFFYDSFSANAFTRLRQRLHTKFMSRIYMFMFRQLYFDVAIAFQEGIYASFVSRTKAKRKLLWIHNDFSLCHWTSNLYNYSLDEERNCYKAFDSIICVSIDVLNSINKIFGSLSNLKVCYNPIDIDEIDQKKVETISEKISQRPLFISVGRLCEQKGFDRLLDAVAKLNKDKYTFEVWILGDGVDRDKLEKQKCELNIHNVSFLGKKDNPYSYMSYADWVLCTSRHEGFCMVLHEAIYLGKAVMTTNNAGAIELLGDSKYGIVIQNTQESIYEGIKNVLDNRTLKFFYEEMAKERKPFVTLNERIESITDLF